MSKLYYIHTHTLIHTTVQYIHTIACTIYYILSYLVKRKKNIQNDLFDVHEISNCFHKSVLFEKRYQLLLINDIYICTDFIEYISVYLLGPLIIRINISLKDITSNASHDLSLLSISYKKLFSWSVMQYLTISTFS